jgi:hypothetical protein
MLRFAQHDSVNLACVTYLCTTALVTSEDYPGQIPKARQADRQEQQGQTEPQTAALPSRSGAADFLHERHAAAPHNPSLQSIKLDYAQQSERGANRHQREPITESDHVGVSAEPIISQPALAWKRSIDFRLTPRRSGVIGRGQRAAMPGATEQAKTAIALLASPKEVLHEGF